MHKATNASSPRASTVQLNVSSRVSVSWMGWQQRPGYSQAPVRPLFITIHGFLHARTASLTALHSRNMRMCTLLALLLACMSYAQAKQSNSTSNHHDIGHHDGSAHHDTHASRSGRQQPLPQKQQQQQPLHGASGRRHDAVVGGSRSRGVPVEDRGRAQTLSAGEALCPTLASGDDLMEMLDETSNCSRIALLWYNMSDDTLPVVTNETIEARVRLPGIAVLGLRFRRPSLIVTIVGYALVNMVATSVVPMPIATSLVPLSTILFGFLAGMVLNVSSTCAGAYLGLLLVRYACRPCFIRALGKHQRKWEVHCTPPRTSTAQRLGLLRC